MTAFPTRIVSGGQTGVDRAALDIAARRGLERGGWCPRGRRAEDGPIGADYPMTESPLAAYAIRTRLNVRDSDATLVLVLGAADAGTRLTIEIAQAMARPYRIVDLKRPEPPVSLRRWLREARVRTLNVAGPRASRAPGIYEQAYRYLDLVLGAVSRKSRSGPGGSPRSSDR